MFFKKGREHRKGGASMSTWRRAQQTATAFRKPFRCLLVVQSSLQVWFVYVFSLLSLYCFIDKFYMVKFCDIGLIKSLHAAELLWGRELKVDAAHSTGSDYSVTLKKIHYGFLCTESNNFNSILSELPRRRNSPALPYATPQTGKPNSIAFVSPWQWA